MAKISDDLAAKLRAHREHKAEVKAARALRRARPAPAPIEAPAPARADWLDLLQPMTLSCNKNK